MVRKQEAQTMALKELLQQPDYFKMNSDEKTQRFNLIKQEKEQELPIIQTNKENSTTSVIKDIGRANNPFNKYSPSQSANLKLSEQSSLANSLDNITKTKLENITDNLHKKQNNSSQKKPSRARSASVISEKSNLRYNIIEFLFRRHMDKYRNSKYALRTRIKNETFLPPL